jgi:hypothetical protein
MTRRVYDALLTRAAAILATGHAVIADAVYAQPEERAALEAAARAAGVPFTGLWLEAPVEALEERIARRTGDASDATVAVLRRQRDLDVGGIGWRRVDARGTPEATLARARPHLADPGEH